MNRRGFTLIELIATIALLAIIAVISFVSISGIINKSKVNDCKNIVLSIKSAVKEYVSDNRYENTFIDGITKNEYNITINALDLVEKNYLDGNIVNPFNKEEIEPEDISIMVTLNKDITVKEIIITNTVLQNCKVE